MHAWADNNNIFIEVLPKLVYVIWAYKPVKKKTQNNEAKDNWYFGTEDSTINQQKNIYKPIVPWGWHQMFKDNFYLKSV